MTGISEPKCYSMCCQKVQNAIFGTMEGFFERFGKFVAKYPSITIIASFIFAGLCMVGFLNFSEETEQNELWIPNDSDTYENSNWLRRKFPSNTRFQQFVIYTEGNENIVTKQNLMLLFEISQNISKLSAQFGDETIDRSTICQPVPNAPTECLEVSILSYWYKSKSSEIGNEIDKTSDVLATINLKKKLPSLPDIDSVLGGIQASIDDDGNSVVKSGTAFKVGLINRLFENYTSKAHEAWEQEFLYYINNLTLPGPLNIRPFATRSFSDIVGKTIGGDAQLLSVGFLVVFIYIAVVLGRFNSVEHRVLLALIGILSIGLGIGTSYGLSSAFGMPYTPLHSILPFLLLGIGIDDMFVIVQSFENVKSDEELSLALVPRFGITLRRAGVAITITSVTDLLAFGISATTVLPALKSFCVYAALGIFFVFIYMASFFVAFFVLDQRRVEGRFDACCCCYRHKDWEPSDCSKRSILQMIFIKYSELVVKLPFKICIMILTIAFVSVGGYGLSLLKTDFKIEWFLDEGTYLRDFFDLTSERFPSSGISGTIWVSEYPNIHTKIKTLDELVKDVSSLNSLSDKGVTSFLPSFFKFVGNQTATDYPNGNTASDMTKDKFNELLFDFYCDPNNKVASGGSLKFKPAPNCGQSTNKSLMLDAMAFGYTHRTFENSLDTIDAMNDVKDRVALYRAKLGPEGRVFAHSEQYSNYVTMEIITSELGRNVLLALICIFFVTLLLLTDVISCLMVLVSVFFTLVDVGGFMHFWGLTIDTSSALLLTVAMGLAVDYGAHIAHYFLTAENGDRNERIQETLKNIGPAVWHGGFSTFLAFILLMTSKSYVFKTFFKIFFLVVAFGLFHGLVFLPVMLSLIGPKPHTSGHDQELSKSSNKIVPKSAAWTTEKS